MARIAFGFGTPEYAAVLARMARSAAPYFDEVHQLSPKDIPASFRAQHAKLFEWRRGYGYWVWKPFLIKRFLDRMKPDDSLFYVDSQCVFESDPSPLIRIAREHDGIGIFHQKRELHRNSTWTRGDCFRLMNCDEPKYWNGDNLASTFSVWTRTKESLRFVSEWLKWCGEYQVVSDEPSRTANAHDFKAHRHDQSILSLLAIKYNRFTMCDPSQWGDGYRCPVCKYPRIIQSIRNVKPPWHQRPTMSSIIEVSTTATCPIRCSFCPQDKLGQAYSGPKTLSLETFTRCLDHLNPEDAIYFAGFVEPCVNSRIVDMLTMALERGHRTRLYTTGRGLNEQQANEINALPLEQIVLHLPDAHGYLNHAKSNLPVLDILAKHGAAWAMAMGAPGEGQEVHPDLAKVWGKLPHQAANMHDRAGNLSDDERRGIVPIHRPGPIRCGVAPTLDHSVMLPSGKLALCCMDYSLAHIVGDLSTTPYSEILAGSAIRDILDRQKDGRSIACRKCVCAEPIK